MKHIETTLACIGFVKMLGLSYGGVSQFPGRSWGLKNQDILELPKDEQVHVLDVTGPNMFVVYTVRKWSVTTFTNCIYIYTYIIIYIYIFFFTYVYIYTHLQKTCFFRCFKILSITNCILTVSSAHCFRFGSNQSTSECMACATGNFLAQMLHV